MRIAVVRKDWNELPTPLLVAWAFEGADGLGALGNRIDEAAGGQVADILRRGDFKATECQTLLLYPASPGTPFERLLVIGLGKRDDFDAERLRRAAATAAKQAGKLEVERFAAVLPDVSGESEGMDAETAGRAIAEGATLGSYAFDEFKSKDADKPTKPVDTVEILGGGSDGDALEQGARVGAALGRGACLARTLGNLPGNVATPTYLADQAKKIADQYGMRVTILGPKELKKEGLGALLAVAQGSLEEPRLIVLEHRRGKNGAKPLVLVGKGLTFDAGGISIKPAAGMEEMKFDMCGGAAVLGAMQAIGELEVPVDVVAIVPASENLLSGGAMKPGDIIRAHSGKTIEVINTDAEGRLILADALSYAQRFEPAAMIDAATLTGACVIALGNQASAGLTNDEKLLDEVRAAGDRVGERVWPMPMFDEYREQIKSDYADIKNSGGRPAGTITAAWFLREFVGDVPWVHLDIAGTAYGDGKLAYQTKGATGVPTRLFVEWVRSRAG